MEGQSRYLRYQSLHTDSVHLCARRDRVSRRIAVREWLPTGSRHCSAEELSCIIYLNIVRVRHWTWTVKNNERVSKGGGGGLNDFVLNQRYRCTRINIMHDILYFASIRIIYIV